MTPVQTVDFGRIVVLTKMFLLGNHMAYLTYHPVHLFNIVPVDSTLALSCKAFGYEEWSVHMCQRQEKHEGLVLVPVITRERSHSENIDSIIGNNTAHTSM